MATVEGATQYFATSVLWADEWVDTSTDMKSKALANAELQLRRYFGATKELPDEAIYEQALWLLRLDDTLRKAEQGVKTISVKGVSVSVDRVSSYIAPEAMRVVTGSGGARVGMGLA